MAILRLYHLHLTNLSDLKFILNLKNKYCTPSDFKKNRPIYVPSCSINKCHYIPSDIIFVHLLSGLSKYFFNEYCIAKFKILSLVTLFLVSSPIKYFQILFRSNLCILKVINFSLYLNLRYLCQEITSNTLSGSLAIT